MCTRVIDLMGSIRSQAVKFGLNFNRRSTSLIRWNLLVAVAWRVLNRYASKLLYHGTYCHCNKFLKSFIRTQNYSQYEQWILLDRWMYKTMNTMNTTGYARFNAIYGERERHSSPDGSYVLWASVSKATLSRKLTCSITIRQDKGITSFLAYSKPMT